MTDSCSMAETLASPKVRYDWYQTETHVILNILHKNVQEDKLITNFADRELNVSFPLSDVDAYNLNIKLLHEINPQECIRKVLPSKIEIKLKKKEGFRWVKLEEDESVKKEIKPIHIEPSTQCEASITKYPSSSLKPKDWDKIAIDIEKSDDDKPEGEAGLNALFQKVYLEGSDEVRRAMNKSYLESGGTVLSTNWGEVRRDKVEMKPPDGMEWKKWN